MKIKTLLNYYLLLTTFFIFVTFTTFPAFADNVAFSPQCSDGFNDLTFSSKSEFTVSLNLNEAGPCDWHKRKPNFGDYDFFSSNMAIFKNTYEGAEELKINFELEASKNFKRGTFFNIIKNDVSACNPDEGNFIRLGIWDGTLFLGTKDPKGKTRFEDINFSLNVNSKQNFEINIYPKTKNKSSVEVLVDGEKQFETFSYSNFCNASEIQMGAWSFGNDNKRANLVTLEFSNISIKGTLSSSSDNDKPDEVVLNYAHLLTSYPLALCNDSSAASFFSSHKLDENFPKKVIIAFEGGGAALSLHSNETKFAEAYDKRPLRYMTSAVQTLNKRQKTLSGYFTHAKQDGWGLIYLNYCSSDLYMGNHELVLDGKKFQVRGRKIIEALLDVLKKSNVLNNDTDLLLVGGSAGDLAISANLDLHEKLPHRRLRLLFTIWQVPSERSYVDGKQNSGFNKIVPVSGLRFTHGKLLPHCEGSFSACGPNLENIQRFKFDDYFIEGHWKEMSSEIFAFTPRHMKNNEKFKLEIKKEIYKAGGGISFTGNKSWKPSKDANHVMGNLTTPIGDPPVIPAEIVWNWISRSGQTRYIGK